MKQKISLLAIAICVLSYAKTYSQNIELPADSLVANIEHYDGQHIETEGLVVHICGVDGKKLKLSTDGGEIIKVVPFDSLGSFDKSLYGKRIKIQGVVKEYRVVKSKIDSLKREKSLLCHIDNTPCIDSVWVDNMTKSGKADAYSEQSAAKLDKKMEKTGNDYISIITIFAEKIEILEVETE
ncbi:MAG: hypothetical protein CVU11_00355 [Bacteroidetes bacterium HGW-Bacteroidetes-6]|jgi:hypothetical protein|nr:MAG: hypothetical protein CVU11_00355 [Bacteroidetes bacterium HGW-Bacteroidetes-6]